MKYEKPELVVLPTAMAAVQGFKIGGPSDGLPSTAAYDADE